MVVVTAKVMDHAQENVLKNLRAIRQAQPARPVILVLTCLHEAYPQQQHPEPYPFGVTANRRHRQAGARRADPQHRRASPPLRRPGRSGRDGGSDAGG